MAYTIGRCRIGILIEQRGWSQRELARIANVPKSNISDYILDKYIIKMEHAKNVATALGCTIDDLYEWILVRTD